MSCQRCGQVHGCDNPLCQNDDIDSVIAKLKQRIADNPWCANCEFAESKDCQVHGDGTCNMIRKHNTLKKQILEGELIPLSVVHNWGCTVEVECPDGMNHDELCRASLKQFAAERAKNELNPS